MNKISVGSIFFLSVCLIFVIFGVPIIFFSRKQRRKAFGKLSNYLPGTISGPLPSFYGIYEGLKFRISFAAVSEGGGDLLEIRLMKNTAFKLRLCKKLLLGNLLKRIGLFHEVKTNDEIFDKEFSIYSGQAEKVIRYFYNSEVKDIVRELFGSGVSYLIIDGASLKIQKDNYQLEQDLQPQRVTDILRKLNLLAQRL